MSASDGDRPANVRTARSRPMRNRLKTVFSTRAARLETLDELTKLGPVPIIADALGYHPSTERHAIGSASAYARYLAVRHEKQ